MASGRPPHQLTGHERSLVKLDIPHEWTLWRVYNSPGVKVEWDTSEWPWCYRLEDPMGEDKFDEATSFPALKPNIDVCGIPDHSRTQRGWYQVKSWPPRSSSSSSDLDDTHPAPASAQDIPPELFQRILGAIGLDAHLRARCGQVCRYWADQCRPDLFDLMDICSRQDAVDFRNFAKDPACRFLPFLEDLAIHADPDLANFNWAHLFATIESCGERLRLKLEGPLPAKMKTLRSIHCALPRSLPTFFSRRIRNLQLKDIRFLRFQDLTHLVGELPDLEMFWCEGVTWDSLPVAELPRRRPAANHKLRQWNVKDCGPSWRQAAVLLFRSMYSTAKFFSDDDVPGILTLLGAQEIANTNDAISESKQSYGLYSLASDFIQLHLDGDFEFSLRAEPRSVLGGSPSFYATNITMDTTLPIGWAALDTVAIELSFLQTVDLLFQDKKSLLRFAEEMGGKQMSVLSRRGLLRLAYHDGVELVKVGFTHDGIS